MNKNLLYRILTYFQILGLTYSIFVCQNAVANSNNIDTVFNNHSKLKTIYHSYTEGINNNLAIELAVMHDNEKFIPRLSIIQNINDKLAIELGIMHNYINNDTIAKENKQNINNSISHRYMIQSRYNSIKSTNFLNKNNSNTKSEFNNTIQPLISISYNLYSHPEYKVMFHVSQILSNSNTTYFGIKFSKAIYNNTSVTVILQDALMAKKKSSLQLIFGIKFSIM